MKRYYAYVEELYSNQEYLDFIGCFDSIEEAKRAIYNHLKPYAENKDWVHGWGDFGASIFDNDINDFIWDPDKLDEGDFINIIDR